MNPIKSNDTLERQGELSDDIGLAERIERLERHIHELHTVHEEHIKAVYGHAYQQGHLDGYKDAMEEAEKIFNKVISGR